MGINPFPACILWLIGLLPVVCAAETHSTYATHPPGAVIASAHELATQAGLEIIEQGGNAFDAAVAVSSTLAVVEPISSGLGGGGFFLLYQASNNHSIMLDARETAPAAATSAQFLDKDGNLDRDRAINGPWSVGIPGLPAALVKLAGDYGRLPLRDSLAPAIRIASDGFPAYARLVRGYTLRQEVMERYPGTREVFLRHGEPLVEGEVFKQPELAHTLQRLADHGFDGFYKGITAQLLITGVNAEGGDWNAEELAAYTVKTREPIHFNYRGWNITTAPPPSSGGIALATMLHILEGWDLQRLDETQRTHLIIEAMRRAYRDRTFFLGDPDFVTIPQSVLTSRHYAQGLRAGIHPQKATPSELLSGIQTPLEDEETTHFSIIDQEGNRVSGTQTINLLYGSGFIPSGTGVLLNNEMDDFALKPGAANAFGVTGYQANSVAPGKRMLSSMTPTFMENKQRVIVLGTPGGSRIITMVLLGILGYDAGLSTDQVAALPRYHHQWLPDQIMIESHAFSPELMSELEEMGHSVYQAGNTATAGRGSSHVWGNMQTVEWNRVDNTLHGSSDPRHSEGSTQIKIMP